MEKYIFFIVSVKRCCPSNCCLCFLSSGIPVENILLIMCSNIFIFLSGLVRKVGMQMEFKKREDLFSGYLFYGATHVGQ